MIEGNQNVDLPLQKDSEPPAFSTPMFRVADSILGTSDLDEAQLNQVQDSILAYCHDEQASLTLVEQEIMENFDFDEKNVQAYYQKMLQYLVENGFISNSALSQIANRLIDFNQIVITNRPYSGFSFRDLVYPTAKEDLEISIRHVAYLLTKLKAAFAFADLTEAISLSQLVEISVLQALAHEFAHVFESFLRVTVAQKINPEVQTVKNDNSRRAEYWRLWDEVDAEIAIQFFAQFSTNDPAKNLGLAAHENVHSETLAKSFEYALLRLGMKRLDFGEEEIEKVEKFLLQQHAASLNDFVQFVQHADHMGISQDQYESLVRKLNIPELDGKLPHYGLDLKQAGYYLRPLTSESLKAFIAHFAD